MILAQQRFEVRRPQFDLFAVGLEHPRRALTALAGLHLRAHEVCLAGPGQVLEQARPGPIPLSIIRCRHAKTKPVACQFSRREKNSQTLSAGLRHQSVESAQLMLILESRQRKRAFGEESTGSRTLREKRPVLYLIRTPEGMAGGVTSLPLPAKAPALAPVVTTS